MTMCNSGEGVYPVGDIARALKISTEIYGNLTFEDEFDDNVREELEITILGLIKSLRISAFYSSEKR